MDVDGTKIERDDTGTKLMEVLCNSPRKWSTLFRELVEATFTRKKGTRCYDFPVALASELESSSLFQR